MANLTVPDVGVLRVVVVCGDEPGGLVGVAEVAEISHAVEDEERALQR